LCSFDRTLEFEQKTLPDAGRATQSLCQYIPARQWPCKRLRQASYIPADVNLESLAQEVGGCSLFFRIYSNCCAAFQAASSEGCSP
jgi:hypothetical protein